MPFVHSVEQDPAFKCFSVVDERSAGHFALGLAQQLGRPAAVCCTSGTAVINMLSAANESRYQRVPLLFITADRAEYLHDQYQDQMAPTREIYEPVCKTSVTLPIVRDDDDEWRCMLSTNQALSELSHRRPGSVHINVQVREEDVFRFNTTDLPEVTRIARIMVEAAETTWSEMAKLLASAGRVLVAIGQTPGFAAEELACLREFADRYGAVVVVDHLSNITADWVFRPSATLLSAAPDTLRRLAPDIIVTFGGHTVSGLTKLMSHAESNAQHWSIDQEGEFIDTFRHLSAVFECSPQFFFSKLNAVHPRSVPDHEYSAAWGRTLASSVVPDFEYSDVYAVQRVIRELPEGALLHLANSASVRYAQLFDLPIGTTVRGNRGSNGIDGSLSTFVGASQLCKRNCYLIIGDLSFFYDMTGLWNRHVGANLRILLNNNFGGMIFNSHLFWAPYDGVNDYTAAEHDTSAKAWAESRSFRYLSASNTHELEAALPTFFREETDQPVLLEVFTSKPENDRVFWSYFRKVREVTPERIVKSVLRRVRAVGNRKS